MITLAFDIYGTLIDTAGISTALKVHVADQAPQFASLWREKQLEYTFRRGLMRDYQDFWVCTRQALDYVCLFLEAEIPVSEKDALMNQYRTLPAFSDVRDGLAKLSNEKFRLFAFSNGTAELVKGLLEHADIDNCFTDIVSADEISSFKPDPAVYRHFLKRANTLPTKGWLISCNPFDVIGAHAAGMQTAWVKRLSKKTFDPWGIEPTITVSSLDLLSASFPC